VTPEPARRCENLDAEGNSVTQVWFASETGELLIEAQGEVETLRTNPFDFLLTDEELRFVPVVSTGRRRALAPYCSDAGSDAGVRALAESVAASVNWETLRFLTALSERLYKICRHVPRDEGPPQPAPVTLSRREGACRDVAVLFVEACRTQGLAARFVSGYQEGEESWESHEMHAWAEVYLPGGGWRGFDPTHGLAAGESLVPVAAALDPNHAAPLTGTYRGNDVTHQMSFEINVQRQTTPDS
jgi:transglutaminase-like putative cysteine protease